VQKNQVQLNFPTWNLHKRWLNLELPTKQLMDQLLFQLESAHHLPIYIPENSKTEKMGLVPQFNLYSFESLGICPNNREAVVVGNWFDDHGPIVCACLGFFSLFL
jgi:hypothetical protein